MQNNHTPPVSQVPFLRRIYFERNTMEIIVAYHMEGGFLYQTVEEDWANDPALVGYQGNRDMVDVLEWQSPDPAVEEICKNSNWIGVRRIGDGLTDYEVFDDTASIQNGEPDTDRDDETNC